MKSGRKTLTWDSPLPRAVHRRHEDPDTSDNFSHIIRASEEILGPDMIRATDTNLQAYFCKRLGKWVKCGGHWKYPGGNGYTRIKLKRLPGTRPMTYRERHRENWDWDDVRRWRRKNGEMPRTYEELIAFGVAHHVVVIGEEKHPIFAHADQVRELVELCKLHGHPAWFMVLVTLAPKGKVLSTRAAGGQIALIFGSNPVRKPSTWPWAVPPNRVWPFQKGWLPTS